MQVQNLPYLDKQDPFSSHSVIGRWLSTFPAGSKILDVGTATGIIGRLCQGKGFILTGIEPMESWAKAARPLYQHFSTTVLSETPDELIQEHQVVVCADILEHTPDPDAELRRLVQLQPEGAVFLISIPNIANLWVRFSLLFGQFEYTDRGILDRSHLRFFTRRSLLRMVAGTGLETKKVVPTPIPLSFVHPFFERTTVGRWMYRLLASITLAFPTLFGYQFVIYAIKPSH